MKPPEPSIRVFMPEDLPAMQRVRAAAFAPVFRSFAALVGEQVAAVALAHADDDQAKLLNALCEPGTDHLVLVVTLADEVVGFVTYRLNTVTRVGEIGLNAVHPDHAGRGLGAMMYEHVLARMKARGMAVAEVGTGADPSHGPARRAYAKVGFGPSIPSVTLYKVL